MKSSKFVPVITAALLNVAAATAAKIDMSDPRRALGRDDNIRIDAQLVQDTVASGSPVGVTVQIENNTQSAIGVAEKSCELSYDDQTGTITLSVGSEIPKDGVMPHLATIAPGEKKTFTTGAMFRASNARMRSPLSVVPRLVAIKVNVLRNLAPFINLIERQKSPADKLQLTDEQFEQWLESNDAIFLNALPVRFDPNSRSTISDASQGLNPGGSF